jgi:hypothetical protein
VNAQQPMAEQLAGHPKMSQIRQRVAAAGEAAAVGVDRPVRPGQFRPADRVVPQAREHLAVAGEAGGQHAVEQVASPLDRIEHALGVTQPHDVPGSIHREDVSDHLQGGVALGRRLPDAQSPDAKTAEANSAVPALGTNIGSTLPDPPQRPAGAAAAAAWPIAGRGLRPPNHLRAGAPPGGRAPRRCRRRRLVRSPPSAERTPSRRTSSGR